MGKSGLPLYFFPEEEMLETSESKTSQRGWKTAIGTDADYQKAKGMVESLGWKFSTAVNEEAFAGRKGPQVQEVAEAEAILQTNMLQISCQEESQCFSHVF